MSQDTTEPLSERELELLDLLSKGLSNREIANKLHISPNTVKVHLRNIYTKLKVRSRTEATMVAIQSGLVKVDLAQEQPGSAAEIQEQTSRDETEATIPPAASEAPPSLGRWRRIYLIAAALAVTIGVWVTWPRRIEPEPGLSQVTPSAPLRLPGERWKSLANLPTPRGKLAAVFYDGRVFAIGGETATGVSGAVDVYDPKQDRWTSGTSKTTPAAHVGAVVLHGKIFVPGGIQADGTMSDKLEIYIPDGKPSGIWQAGQNLPKALCAYAIAVYEGELYLFGGWDGDAYLTSSYRYNARQDQWHELAPMPTGRAFAAAGTIGQHIYVVGGHDGQTELSQCQIYDPNGNDWQSCPAMKIPRSGAGAAVIDNKLHVVGGEKREGDAVLESEFLEPNDNNPAQGVWQAFPSPFFQEWRYPGVAASDEILYAVGGWRTELVGAARAYQVIYRVYLPVGSRGN